MNDADFYVRIATWSQVLSSIAFFGVVLLMWYRWIVPVLMQARDRSNSKIAEAERHRDEVKGALVALKDEIDNAHHDAGLIVQRAEQHAAREHDALIAEAKESGERAMRDAEGELDRARAAARVRLRDEIVARALDIARGDAASRAGASVDARLVGEVTSSLEQGTRG